MKTILVTGGTSGLGLEACKQLAASGNRISFIGRDEQRCIEAKNVIERAGGKDVDYFIADLSSQNQIRKLNEEIHKRIPKIDVLINNAGGVFSGFALTEDGIEKTFALNHLGYFLLTHLVQDIIPEGARIINVSSDSHYRGDIDFESFQKNKNYNILKAYAQSKLANVLFTYELARRVASKNITVNALHPGRVRTHIGNKSKAWYHSFGWSLLTAISSITPTESVRTFVYLAESDEVNNVTGKYFAFSKAKPSSEISYDEELAKKLWQVSAELTGVSA
jgi:NAD(P)-dependent dehydrogenase (short-subunit alcohol dehydrogenase family)